MPSFTSNESPTTEPRSRRDAGFGLLELMIVVAIVGVLSAVAFPVYQSHVVRAKISEGIVAVSAAKTAVVATYAHSGRLPDSNVAAGLAEPQALNSKFVRQVEVTSGGAIHATMSVSPVEGEDLILKPTVIGGSIEWRCYSLLIDPAYLPATCRGASSVADTIVFLIGRMRDPVRVPARTWGDYACTDLGLDPQEWCDEAPRDGVIFKPGGEKLSIRPAPGYIMTITDSTGTPKTLTSSLQWNFVYSLADNRWYFKSAGVGPTLDISTLVVAKSAP
ncbi:MAG: prepilin-type N-terminal cleavage/methylation domain-containing protein [Gammaproteobacteria bacterium]|nr:prepilin-type N-terminal cleavage/methylation domain-containing protein [Gammaproteobacteria bacterium]